VARRDNLPALLVTTHAKIGNLHGKESVALLVMSRWNINMARRDAGLVMPKRKIDEGGTIL